MAKLEYSVHVAPAKLVASDDFPPGETREMWSPTASTLIYGDRDAVLVDPLMTKDESRALADWVVATGKNVTAIFVTHAHGDHFFGAPALLERFPDARVVAAPGVAARMDAQYALLDGFWNLRFPGQISGQRVTAEPLTDGVLELEGEQLRAIELRHTDTDGTSALHVPSTGLVVAGDAVYGDVNLYLVEAKGNGRQEWLNALDTVERLQPQRGRRATSRRRRRQPGKHRQDPPVHRRLQRRSRKGAQLQRPLRGDGRPLPGQGEPRRHLALRESLSRPDLALGRRHRPRTGASSWSRGRRAGRWSASSCGRGRAAWP